MVASSKKHFPSTNAQLRVVYGTCQLGRIIGHGPCKNYKGVRGVGASAAGSSTTTCATLAERSGSPSSAFSAISASSTLPFIRETGSGRALAWMKPLRKEQMPEDTDEPFEVVVATIPLQLHSLSMASCSRQQSLCGWTD